MMRRLPVLPSTPAEEWEAIYARADAAMASKVRAAERDAGVASPCREGCSACCSKPALIEACEAPSLEAAVQDLDAEAQKRVRRRLGEWLVGRRRLGLRGGPMTEHHQRRFAREGMALDHARLPCPLLENARCMIYARRPLTCRLHAVVGDPALCADPGAIVGLVHARPILQAAVDDAVHAFPDGRTFSDVRFLPEWLRVIFQKMDADGTPPRR